MEPLSVHKTVKYKLPPPAEQEGRLALVVRRCCERYTAARQERREAWRMRGVSVPPAMQRAQLPGIKEVRPEYQDRHSPVLQEVRTRLDRAFQAFFRRVTSGEKPGYVRFRRSARDDSFTSTPCGNGATRDNTRDNGMWVLSQLGRMAGRWSRPIAGTPKPITMRRAAAGWYACFSCADVPIQPLPLTGQQTGIDLGRESFATLADGRQMANPRLVRVAAMNLKRAPRRVSRRVKDSHRRHKAVVWLAQAHQTVRRARAAFQHKTARALVRADDTIDHENLQPANRGQNHQLAKSISDAGWRACLSSLAFTAVEAGKTGVAVPAAFTSQACSGCGVLVHTGLSVRWHACPACGTSLHRDHNAALHIWQRGPSRGAGQVPQGLPWAVGPSVA